MPYWDWELESQPQRPYLLPYELALHLEEEVLAPDPSQTPSAEVDEVLLSSVQWQSEPISAGPTVAFGPVKAQVNPSPPASGTIQTDIQVYRRRYWT